MATVSPALYRRAPRVVPAVITAVMITALGVAIMVTAAHRLITGGWFGFEPPTWRWLTGLRWSSAAVWWIAAAALVVGVVLVLAALLPGRANGMRLDVPRSQDPSAGTPPSAEQLITRRALARLAVARTQAIDGVDTVSASVRGRSVRLKITTPLRQRDEVDQAVGAAARSAFEDLGLPIRVRTGVVTSRAD